MDKYKCNIKENTKAATNKVMNDKGAKETESPINNSKSPNPMTFRSPVLSFILAYTIITKRRLNIKTVFIAMETINSVRSED
ncbi:hypothetical protein GCM10022395_01680 [Snuella lapsa]|uniref:Uncharacterized protein n=1 Tax=Snuella lapsa TaxID=870481 RepID=A0ABP6WNL7_9FLAO